MPCQATNVEGVTTNWDECTRVHGLLARPWKRTATHLWAEEIVYDETCTTEIWCW